MLVSSLNHELLISHDHNDHVILDRTGANILRSDFKGEGKYKIGISSGDILQEQFIYLGRQTWLSMGQMQGLYTGMGGSQKL